MLALISTLPGVGRGRSARARPAMDNSQTPDDTSPERIAAFTAHWRTQLDAALLASGRRYGSVATELGLGESSFNKRRRGEVPFSVEHFLALSERFGLPITPGELWGRKACFTLPPGRARFDAEDFVRGFGRIARLVTPEAIAAGHCEVTVSATDIPVTRVFANRALTALKLYFFRTRHQGAAAPDEYFSLADELESITAVDGELRALTEAYGAVGSREVWGEAPLRSVCHQVHHLIRQRAVDRADAEELFAQLHRLVDALQEDLSDGAKPGGGRTEVFRDRLFAHSPMITIRTPTTRAAVLTHDPPHYMMSTDAVGFEALTVAFERRLARAEAIGRHGSVSARAYCADLHRTVDEAGEVARALFRVSMQW